MKVVKSHFQWFKLAPLIFCWGIGVCSSACDLKLLEPIIHIEACQKVIFGCVSPSILFTSCHYSSHFLFKSLVTFCQLVNKNVFAAKSSSSSLSLSSATPTEFFSYCEPTFFFARWSFTIA